MPEEISLHEVVLAIKGGQKGIARELLHRRLKTAPQCVQSLLMAAALAERVPDATDLLNRVLVLDPSNEQAVRTLGMLRLMNTAGPQAQPAPPKPAKTTQTTLRSAAAAKIFKCPICKYSARFDSKAVCSVCGCVQRYECLGLVRQPGVDEKLVSEAVDRLREDLTLRQNQFALRYLSVALLNLGRTTEALTYLRRLLAHDPTNGDVRRLVEDIARQNLVMVVDDSATIRRVVSAMLSEHGYRVLAAFDAFQALEWIHEGHRPEAFLLDYEMPGMNGFQLCREVRKNAAFKHTPVIMISGNILDRMKAKLAGADELVKKPFTAEGLVEVIRRRTARQTEAPAGALAASAA